MEAVLSVTRASSSRCKSHYTPALTRFSPPSELTNLGLDINYTIPSLSRPTSLTVLSFDQAYYPPVFSLALNRTLVSTTSNTQPSKTSGGVLAFGGLPDVSYDPESWVQTAIIPVSASVYTYYSIKVDGFNITAPMGSTVTPRNYAASRQSIIVDSGTTLIYLPDRIADYIASLFQPAATYNANTGLYIVSCQAIVPAVGVNIAGTSFFISADDLLNRGSGAVGGTGTGAGAGQCVLAIQRTDGGAAVLGDSWLKNVLVVFDLGANKIRVARRDIY